MGFSGEQARTCGGWLFRREMKRGRHSDTQASVGWLAADCEQMFNGCPRHELHCVCVCCLLLLNGAFPLQGFALRARVTLNQCVCVCDIGCALATAHVTDAARASAHENEATNCDGNAQLALRSFAAAAAASSICCFFDFSRNLLLLVYVGKFLLSYCLSYLHRVSH